jgi:hypothetical protein
MVAWLGTIASQGTITVNWDSTGTNQAMTVLESANESDNNCSVQLWGLLAPTSGNKTLSIAWTGPATEVIAWCSDFINVNQTSNATAFINGTTSTGTSTHPVIVINSKAGDVTIDGGNEGNTTNPTLASATQTGILTQSGGGATNPFGSRSAGGQAQNTHQWTLIASDPWAETGVDIAQIPATATSTNTHIGINGSKVSITGGKVTIQ